MSLDSVNTEIEAIPWHELSLQLLREFLSRSHGDETFLAVRRRAESQNATDRKQQTKRLFGEKPALNRAREIATLLGLILLLERRDGNICGLSCDLPNDHFALLGFGKDPPSYINGFKTTSLFPARSNVFQTQSAELLDICKKPFFDPLYRAVIDYKDPKLCKVRTVMVRSLVRIGHALHSDAGGQLLGAYTSMEILLNGEQEAITNRIQSLIGEVGTTLWKSVTKARNDYVHTGAEVSEFEAKRSVYLATYTLFAFARLADRFPGESPDAAVIIELIDGRWTLKNKIRPLMQRYATDEQLFQASENDFTSIDEKLFAEGESWDGLSAMYDLPDTERQAE